MLDCLVGARGRREAMHQRAGLVAAEHALAEAQAVRKQAETALNGANDWLNELERDLDEARAAGTVPAVPDMRPGRFFVSHVPRIVVERGRSGAATTEHEQRLHSEATLHDAIRRVGGLTVAATQALQHRPTSTAERLRA